MIRTELGPTAGVPFLLVFDKQTRNVIIRHNGRCDEGVLRSIAAHLMALFDEELVSQP